MVHIPIVYVSPFGVVLACKCRPLVQVEQVPHLAAGGCGGLKCEGYTTTWDAILAITVARILGTDFDQAWNMILVQAPLNLDLLDLFILLDVYRCTYIVVVFSK